MKELLIRSFTGEGAKPSHDGGRTISGYAIMFDVWSQLLCDTFGHYFEKIERGAVSQEDLQRFDVRALAEHDTNRLLARWRHGEGTLRLEVDEVGLKYTFEAPNTPDGDTVLELVRRGDLFGSSFSFLPEEETVVWGKNEDGFPTRTIRKIIFMDDVSVVSNPAYMQTTVSASELERRGYKSNLQGTESLRLKEYFNKQRKANEKALNGFND